MTTDRLEAQENGAKVQNGAGGTVTIKFWNGEHVELDRVTPANTAVRNHRS
jgi:hypothetical protein